MYKMGQQVELPPQSCVCVRTVDALIRFLPTFRLARSLHYCYSRRLRAFLSRGNHRLLGALPLIFIYAHHRSSPHAMRLRIRALCYQLWYENWGLPACSLTLPVPGESWVMIKYTQWFGSSCQINRDMAVAPVSYSYISLRFFILSLNTMRHTQFVLHFLKARNMFKKYIEVFKLLCAQLVYD